MIAPGKIFIIDDDPVYRLIARKLIEKNGFFTSIEFFLNGSEGLRALRELMSKEQDLPGTIFLDIDMPIMNGWQFMEEFIKMPDEVREAVNVYIVSSSVADEDTKRAKSYPEIKRYITKPLTLSILNSITEG